MFGRLSFIISVICLAVVGGLLLARASGPGSVKITFLSVGQGDCTVWQDGSTTVLIDVGPKTREGYDAGERIVLPKLRKMGIGNVALILVTHPDADHIGGLRAIRNRFPFAKVVVSARFKEHKEMLWWLQEARVPVAQVVWIEDRSRIRFGQTSLEIVAPEWSPGFNDNEGSLFVRMESGGSSAILTGDAFVATEERLQKRLAWRAQILKVGHHGSRTSTSESFLKSTEARWAVVSCGRDNRFDHPHKSVVEILRRHTDVFRTDAQGDIAFELGEKGFTTKQSPWNP